MCTRPLPGTLHALSPPPHCRWVSPLRGTPPWSGPGPRAVLGTADCGVCPGAAAGPGAGQGGHCRDRERSLSGLTCVSLAQRPQPVPGTSLHFRCSPPRLSSGLSPPTAQSRRQTLPRGPGPQLSSSSRLLRHRAPLLWRPARGQSPENSPQERQAPPAPTRPSPPQGLAHSRPEGRTVSPPTTPRPRSSLEPRGEDVWGHHTFLFLPAFGRGVGGQRLGVRAAA